MTALFTGSVSGIYYFLYGYNLGLAMTETCYEYRQSLILQTIRKRLAEGDLDEEEQIRLKDEAARLEAALGMD